MEVDITADTTDIIRMPIVIPVITPAITMADGMAITMDGIRGITAIGAVGDLIRRSGNRRGARMGCE